MCRKYKKGTQELGGMDDHPGAQDDHQGRSSSLPPAAGSSHGSGCRSFGADEEDLIIKLHALLGDRWSLIAGRLPGRTDTEVRNYWDTCIKGKLINMGIDPENHRLSRKPVRLVEDSGDTDQVSDMEMTIPTPSLGDEEKLAPEHEEPKLQQETESGSSPTLPLFK